MLYLQTTSKTSETTHMFTYGLGKCIYLTALPVSDEISIEKNEVDGNITVNLRDSEDWTKVKKSYSGIYRVFLNYESLHSYCSRFNKYYNQDNKLIEIQK